MARHYGQIMSAIWNDADFRALSGAAQRVYLMLVTQAEISSAGTLAITLKRWSRYARDTPSDALSDALSELESTAFIVQDYASEELLVRSFVKWDGGASNIKRRPAIKAAAEAVESPRLRAVLAAQLTKLGVPHNITDSLSGKASDTPRVVVTEGEYVPEPQPATRKPQPRTVALPGAAVQPRRLSTGDQRVGQAMSLADHYESQGM